MIDETPENAKAIKLLMDDFISSADAIGTRPIDKMNAIKACLGVIGFYAGQAPKHAIQDIKNAMQMCIGDLQGLIIVKGRN